VICGTSGIQLASLRARVVPWTNTTVTSALPCVFLSRAHLPAKFKDISRKSSEITWALATMASTMFAQRRLPPSYHHGFPAVGPARTFDGRGHPTRACSHGPGSPLADRGGVPSRLVTTTTAKCVYIRIPGVSCTRTHGASALRFVVRQGQGSRRFVGIHRRVRDFGLVRSVVARRWWFPLRLVR
jgi:hypothetical protein